uniref:PH domain-containing protein n=1 Tax=Branchiostoma floridae TaxID=7739 RepID=C3Y6Q0_BRAFL|eukprot:XP_002608000.1 hypothetical protein BRAFLDRAFT_74952 [Branchiostoma floridae]
MEGPMMGGYLSVPSQKAIKKIWSRRYFLLYPTSGSGVVRLLQFESQEQAKKGPKGAKIIPLKDCVAITPSAEHKSQPNVIDIVFPDKTLSFAAESEKLLNNWYLKLCKAVFGGNSPNVADSSAAAPPPYSPPQIPSSQPPPYRATEPPEGATAQEYSGMADNVIYAAQEIVAVKPRLSQKAEEPESDLYEPLGDYYAEVGDVKPAVEPEYSEAEMRMQAWKQQGRSVKEKELASATFDPNMEDYHVPAVPSKSKPPPVAPRAKKRVDHIYDAPPAIGEDSEDYTEPTEMHSDRPPGFEDDEGVYEDTEAITKPAKKAPAPPPPVPRHAPKARKPVVESPYEEPPREITGMIAKFNKMQSGDDGSYDSLNFSPEGKKNKPVVTGDGEYGALYSTVPSNYQDEPDETYDRLENAISGMSFKDSEGPVYHVLEGPYSPVGTTEKHIYDEVPTEQFQPN